MPCSLPVFLIALPAAPNSRGSQLKFAYIIAVLLLGGCSAAGLNERIRVADTVDQVVNCHFLAEVRGGFGLMAAMQPEGMRADAVRQIRAQAARLGGNVITIDSAATIWAGTEAIANVYRC